MTRPEIVISNVFAGSMVMLLTRPIVAFGSLFWTKVSAFTTVQLWWFASSKPAGVKLHPQLSGALSTVGLQYIGLARAVCVALGDVALFSYRGVSFNVFHGLVFVLGVLTALKGPHVLGRGVGLMTLPITLPSAGMYLGARAHLWLTGLFWRFMREDGSSYKLALSCLLFMPVVLTLPTTIWYAAFVCGMGAVAEAVSGFLASVLVVHALRAGPTDGGPIGSFILPAWS